MKRRGIYPWYSPTLRGIIVYFEVNWYWVDVVLNCTMRFKWVSQSSIATKLVDLLYPREAFWRVTDFKLRGTVKLFLPHPLHAMFVPLFELPAENNKHPNFVWRGGGRVVHSFVLWNDPIWAQSLNNSVADCWLSFQLFLGVVHGSDRQMKYFKKDSNDTG